MHKRPTVQQIKDRLIISHGGIVELVESTYIDTKTKCTFVDIDFGEFVAVPNNLIRQKSNHPKRSKEKRKLTCLKKYGVLYNTQSEICKEKSRQTFLLHYGVDNPFGSELIKQQIRKQNNVLYGVDNPMQRQDVKEKVVRTNIERYGTSCTLQNVDVKAKIRNTNLARYGFENPLQNRDIMIKALRSNRRLKIVNHWKTNVELICAASYEYAFVNWANQNKIDFDWQIPIKMPCGKTYIIDAYIKSGQFIDTWIEIKGRFIGDVSRQKWEWFHETHSCSELWTVDVLIKNGVLTTSGKPMFS